MMFYGKFKKLVVDNILSLLAYINKLCVSMGLYIRELLMRRNHRVPPIDSTYTIYVLEYFKIFMYVLIVDCFFRFGFRLFRRTFVPFVGFFGWLIGDKGLKDISVGSWNFDIPVIIQESCLLGVNKLKILLGLPIPVAEPVVLEDIPVPVVPNGFFDKIYVFYSGFCETSKGLCNTSLDWMSQNYLSIVTVALVGTAGLLSFSMYYVVSNSVVVWPVVSSDTGSGVVYDVPTGVFSFELIRESLNMSRRTVGVVFSYVYQSLNIHDVLRPIYTPVISLINPIVCLVTPIIEFIDPLVINYIQPVTQLLVIPLGFYSAYKYGVTFAHIFDWVQRYSSYRRGVVVGGLSDGIQSGIDAAQPNRVDVGTNTVSSNIIPGSPALSSSSRTLPSPEIRVSSSPTTVSVVVPNLSDVERPPGVDGSPNRTFLGSPLRWERPQSPTLLQHYHRLARRTREANE